MASFCFTVLRKLPPMVHWVIVLLAKSPSLIELLKLFHHLDLIKVEHLCLWC